MKHTIINHPTPDHCLTLFIIKPSLLVFICFLFFSGQIISQDKLKIAACQFPVSGKIPENSSYIKGFIREAALNGCDIIQFPEQALSGYPPVDILSFQDYNWDLLRAETKSIMALAKELNIWVVLGSSHFISENEKPLNCLYIISNQGKIVDRYDKSMLTEGDLKFFTPGNHIVVMDIKGYRLGFLICYDSCFPEMYNVYRHENVKIMIHSFYNAHHSGRSILDDVIPAEIRVRASDNLMWVIASNSSGTYSSWPTCIARPDGSIESLEREKPGILYREFPDDQITHEFPSWMHNNKMMALPVNDVYHNGIPSNHKRALDRKSLP